MQIQNADRDYLNMLVGILFIIVLSVCFVLNIGRPTALFISFVNKIATEDTIENFETDLAQGFAYKSLFVDMNGLAHKILLQRTMNDVVLLDNGHGSELLDRTDFSEEGIESNAESLADFSEWLADRGIDLTFMLEPYKCEKDSNHLPNGLSDYSNELSDGFLNALDNRGVDYIDIRECIKEDGKDYYSLFLKTEHHWRPEGGFYAFIKLSRYLETQYGEEIDPYPLDISHYEQVTYKGASLGYYGDKTGRIFMPPEDYTLIYPGWKTLQSCEIPHKNLIRKGTFYDTVFDQDFFAKGRHGMYHAYIGGDFPIVLHESETAKNDKKILMFIDSFAIVPEAFLTTEFKHVYAIDLRWVLRNGMHETAIDFVKQYQPDHVIVSLNPSQLGWEENGLEQNVQFDYGLE